MEAQRLDALELGRRACAEYRWATADEALTLADGQEPLGPEDLELLAESEPLIRVKPKHLDAAGVKRVPRTVGARGGLPLLADDSVLDVPNVIWATGYRTAYEWLDLAGVDGDRPDLVTDRGVVAGEPGLYFVGRPFLYAFNSHTIGGVGRDAAHVVEHIAARTGVASVHVAEPAFAR